MHLKVYTFAQNYFGLLICYSENKQKGQKAKKYFAWHTHLAFVHNENKLYLA